jgi:hypothetical protein
MTTLRNFIAIYRLYRAHNPRKYALQSAYRIAIQRLPF